MTPETTDTVDELIGALPAHLRENFERANRDIQENYKVSPGIAVLIRMWLACGRPSQIAKEFEYAVLDIKRREANPVEEHCDEDVF
jgi:hypothetical protein